MALAESQNPDVQAEMKLAVNENRVATREKKLIAEGALAGMQPYENSLSQAKTNLRNAIASLDAARRQQQAMGQNLQSLNAQFIVDPGNQELRGAVQQAMSCVISSSSSLRVRAFSRSASSAEVSASISTISRQAAMMDPHLQSELSIDDIVRLCDDLIAAHDEWLPFYH